VGTLPSEYSLTALEDSAAAEMQSESLRGFGEGSLRERLKVESRWGEQPIKKKKNWAGSYAAMKMQSESLSEPGRRRLF
jgi:hypothetical protein